MEETAETLIAYSRENSRVCPLPMKWQALWKMLPNRVQKGAGEPALPLILAAWHDTPALLKMARVQEHINWASDHNALKTVSVFLRGLSEDDWFHLGE